MWVQVRVFTGTGAGEDGNQRIVQAQQEVLSPAEFGQVRTDPDTATGALAGKVEKMLGRALTGMSGTLAMHERPGNEPGA
jgi:hypothetical protein